MIDTLDKIKSRGHWRVIIHPGAFVSDRVKNVLDLYPIIEKTSVHLRGWDYPHVNDRVPPEIGLDWVSQSTDWNSYVEFWRFFQSGQFVHYFGMEEDWLDQSQLFNPAQDWRPGNIIGVRNVLFTFTEIFEFAARLAFTDAGDEQMQVKVTLHGLKGRTLWNDDPRRGWFKWRQAASIEDYAFAKNLSRVQLVAESWDLALQAACELYRRFGYEPPIEVLRDQQAEIRRLRVG